MIMMTSSGTASGSQTCTRHVWRGGRHRGQVVRENWLGGRIRQSAIRR